MTAPEGPGSRARSTWELFIYSFHDSSLALAHVLYQLCHYLCKMQSIQSSLSSMVGSGSRLVVVGLPLVGLFAFQGAEEN